MKTSAPPISETPFFRENVRRNKNFEALERIATASV